MRIIGTVAIAAVIFTGVVAAAFAHGRSVWIWYPNPDGMYASMNPLVHAFG